MTLVGRRRVSRLVTAVVLLSVGSVHADAFDVGGKVGYNYRLLADDANQDTTNEQMQVGFDARSYVWRPWLATMDLGMFFTQDSAEFGSSTTTESQIITGDLNLNVLPQSNTPMLLNYHASDSRVESTTTDQNSLISFGSQDYETKRWSLAQSLLQQTDYGKNRYQFRYDNNEWSSPQSGTYVNDVFSVNGDIKGDKQRLSARASLQNVDNDQSKTGTVNQVVNVDHFYYPKRGLRLDTMGSYVTRESTIEVPVLNSSTLSYEKDGTDLAQFSSFMFWRPEDKPLTVSGGIRLFDISSDTTGNATKAFNVSATTGAIYQWTKHLRVDGRLDVVSTEDDVDQSLADNEHLGLIYQSDNKTLWGGYYDWYASTAVDAKNSDAGSSQNLTATVGHDLSRKWKQGEYGMIRLSVTQSLSDNQAFGDSDLNIGRVNHSSTLSWSVSGYKGNYTNVYLTLSDLREFGDQENSQQLANFQAVRNQTISRQANVTGNITVQVVQHDFTQIAREDAVTTVTGQITYNHQRLFSFLGLNFMSNLTVSEVSRDGGADRSEWNNSLNYSIGLLDLRLSHRINSFDGHEYDLSYFQLTRRF